LPDAGAIEPLSLPVFQILLSLTDADLHGYAVIKDIERRTAGELRLTASTLYGAIKRMLADGWVEETPELDPADPRRRVYRLTAAGRAAAEAEARRLERLTAAAREKKLLPALRPS
jgi:DNA-binding PadR family transcriptional regulator